MTVTLPTPHVLVELFRVPRSRVPSALRRMGTDRLHLARTPGLRFAKLLGTGDGRTFDVRDADPRTWGVLTVWGDPDDAAAYLQRSPVARGWRAIAEEAWQAQLRPLVAKGRWSGVAPFGEPEASRHDGPVAAITRARLAWGTMRTFWRAVPPVTAELRAMPGLRLAVGIGEAPVGLQGTFSVWASTRALTDFAYRQPAHREAIEATPRVGWYAEELFARFAIEATRGQIFGGDPLEDTSVPT